MTRNSSKAKTLVHLLLILLFTMVSAGMASAKGPFSSAVEESFEESFSLSATGRVSLDNVNGDVTVQAWDSDEVKVAYVKRSRTREGLDRMTVEIDADGDRIHIETEYAKRKQGWNGGDNGGEVEFHIWVPRGARLDEIDLVNGDLAVEGVEGDITADLVNGTVKARGLRGDVEIETVNGDVELDMTDLASDRVISVDSVNGSIELTFPSGVGADIEAETVHGKISNDFGIDVKKGRYVGRSMSGSIGGGGARVELENVNGAIRVVSH